LEKIKGMEGGKKEKKGGANRARGGKRKSGKWIYRGEGKGGGKKKGKGTLT